MGWASGTQLANDVWSAVKDEHMTRASKARIALALIAACEGLDCDTIEEFDCVEDCGLEYDEDSGDWTCPWLV